MLMSSIVEKEIDISIEPPFRIYRGRFSASLAAVKIMT